MQVPIHTCFLLIVSPFSVFGMSLLFQLTITTQFFSFGRCKSFPHISIQDLLKNSTKSISLRTLP